MSGKTWVSNKGRLVPFQLHASWNTIGHWTDYARKNVILSLLLLPLLLLLFTLKLRYHGLDRSIAFLTWKSALATPLRMTSRTSRDVNTTSSFGHQVDKWELTEVHTKGNLPVSLGTFHVSRPDACTLVGYRLIAVPWQSPYSVHQPALLCDRPALLDLHLPHYPPWLLSPWSSSTMMMVAVEELQYRGRDFDHRIEARLAWG